MRNLSRGMLALIAGMLGFVVVVSAIAAWAVFGGSAGTQRGLVVRNEIGETVTLRFEDGQGAAVATGKQQTFVVKREQFPQTVDVLDAGGTAIVSHRFGYDELADAEFRISVDRNGFYPTSQVRTPAP